jgi:hypothetical protein
MPPVCGGAFYLLRASTAEGKVHVRTLSEPKHCSKDERRRAECEIWVQGNSGPPSSLGFDQDANNRELTEMSCMRISSIFLH